MNGLQLFIFFYNKSKTTQDNKFNLKQEKYVIDRPGYRMNEFVLPFFNL